MSSQTEQSLIETEALSWSDTWVLNADGSDELGGEYRHFLLGFPAPKEKLHICIKTPFVWVVFKQYNVKIIQGKPRKWLIYTLYCCTEL